MAPGRGGGLLPYMAYIGMCGPEGYDFFAVLVINRVSIFTILIINRVCFLLSSLELGIFFSFRISFFFFIDNNDQQKPVKSL